MTDNGYLPPLLSGKPRPFREVMTQLHHLGYFPGRERDQVVKLKQRDGEAKDAVSLYQDFHGLRPDGELGPVTQRHLGLPRCGLPDFEESGSCLRKWASPQVTYAHRLRFDTLSSEDVNRAFDQACEQWNKVCGIELKRVDQFSSANIYASSDVIDQRGGTLAWSYLPKCGSDPRQTQLEQRYDTRESWDYNMLVAVICHEIGHALGLSHSSGSNLMAPTYNRRIITPQAGDIEDIQRRYGGPKREPEPSPSPTPGKPNFMLLEAVYDGVKFVGTLRS